MELESLSCNKCGASLEVPPTAKYATCRHCRSQLVVKRTGSAVYTEVLNRIDTRTERMAEDLEALRLQSELDRLDREWEQVEHDWWSRGSLSAPEARARSAGMRVAVILAVVLLFIVTRGRLFYGVSSLMVTALVVYMAIRCASRGMWQQRSWNRIRARRREILRRLDDRAQDGWD